MPPPLFLLLPQTWVMPTASTVVKTLTKNKYLKLPNFKKPEPTFERCDWKLSLPCFIFTTLLLDPSVWQKVVETLKRLQDIYFLQLDHFLTFLCDFSKKCICLMHGHSRTQQHWASLIYCSKARTAYLQQRRKALLQTLSLRDCWKLWVAWIFNTKLTCQGQKGLCLDHRCSC